MSNGSAAVVIPCPDKNRTTLPRRWRHLRGDTSTTKATVPAYGLQRREKADRGTGRNPNRPYSASRYGLSTGDFLGRSSRRGGCAAGLGPKEVRWAETPPSFYRCGD